jgi:hypothetical protein
VICSAWLIETVSGLGGFADSAISRFATALDLRNSILDFVLRMLTLFS